MSEIRLHKDEFGGYAYNDANMMMMQIERLLERQLYRESFDGMKVLTSNNSNGLNEYKSTINIKKRYMLAASRASANLVRTDASTVEPEITTNSDAQDRSNRHNVFRLIEIGIKEGITEGITKIFGKDVTNPILRTTDDSDFKSVDNY